jgi:hypothetical protein
MQNYRGKNIILEKFRVVFTKRQSSRDFLSFQIYSTKEKSRINLGCWLSLGRSDFYEKRTVT